MDVAWVFFSALSVNALRLTTAPKHQAFRKVICPEAQKAIGPSDVGCVRTWTVKTCENARTLFGGEGHFRKQPVVHLLRLFFCFLILVLRVGYVMVT